MRWQSLAEVMAECRRAQEQFALLHEEGLLDFQVGLSEKEVRHLIHSVFRINGLLYLYDLLRGRHHDTRMGVLLGAITYLLDYIYDHHAVSPAAAEPFEKLVKLERAPNYSNPLERSLRRLSEEAWERVPDRELFKGRLDLMLETQRETMAQADDEPISTAALAQLTQEKGHRSLSLYFAAVNGAFDGREELALRRFGLYMQYMDDLEDFYEDRHESRQSPIQTPWKGALKATRLLFEALPELRLHYEPQSHRRYKVVTTWICLYHASILSACVTREVTRRLPTRLRLWADGFSERRAEDSPLFYAAPVGLSRLSRDPHQNGGESHATSEPQSQPSTTEQSLDRNRSRSSLMD